MVSDSRLLIRLQEDLGYSFADPTLLLRCLTHVSFERREGTDHNETLEFLGDAVLNLAISDLLMRRYPNKKEGDLSRMRASLVNSVILAEKAIGLELGKLLRIGKGEAGQVHKGTPNTKQREVILGWNGWRLLCLLHRGRLTSEWIYQHFVQKKQMARELFDFVN